MDAKTYSIKRDSLTEILKKVIDIDQLNSDKKLEFERIRKKCLEDQFNIVLVGEFQGGKSTTFNTFCDGREISPRGALVKTSACRLTARNLADPDAAEFAEVYWKTSKDLILNIEEVLSSHIDIKDDLKKEFKPGDEVLGLSDLLSFENIEHLKLINKAIAAEWKNYENNRANYSPDSLDVLRIATLIVKFANHGEVKNFKSRVLFSVDDIARLIIFPPDWETRWVDGVNAKFGLNEVLFVFIGGIDCFIQSVNLGRLGCSITDCPGLFASKWDTQVAIDTIPKSDAIIYLLRGDRAIGTEETRVLREIQKMPAAIKKLFYAINMKASRHIIDNSIVPFDVAKIKSVGFAVENESIKRYHALLAFLAEFGNGFLNGTLQESSKTIFSEMAARMLGLDQPIDASWLILANQQLMISSVPPKMVEKLDAAAVLKVRELSGFKELFDGVERFIIKNKAYSILITNGGEKAEFALTEIENSLKNREDEATENVAMRQAELERAKNKLEDFQRDAKTIVNDAFPDRVYEILVSNFYEEVILASTEEVSIKIAYKLGKKITAKLGGEMLWMSIWNSEKRDTKMMEVSQPIYQEVMREVIANRAKVWLYSVAKGESSAYNNSITPEAERIEKLLEKRWEELSGIQINIPRLEYPEISQVFDSLIGNASNKINSATTLNSFYQVAKWELITSVMEFIFMSPKLLFNWVWDVASDLFDIVRRSKPEPDIEKTPEVFSDLDYKGRQLYPNIKNGISSSYGAGNNYSEIRSKILDTLKNIGKFFKEQCFVALENQKKKFREDFEISEANLKRSSDERMKVANSARQLRENHIIPRRKEIMAFIADAKHSMGEA